MHNSNLCRWMAGAALMLTLAMPAASEPATMNGWEFGAEAYLWGASIGGESVTGDDIDISFTDLVKDLEFGFMTTLVAANDRFSLLADLIYLNIEDDENGTANLVGVPAQASIDVELEGFITTLLGGYAAVDGDSVSLDLVAGARYLWLQADANFAIGAPFPPANFPYSDDGHVWDGVVGFRGRTEIADRWYMTLYADVGTGDSDLTWQVKAGVHYEFKKVSAALGYRYMTWDFEDSNTFDDLNFGGPYMGVTFRF